MEGMNFRQELELKHCPTKETAQRKHIRGWGGAETKVPILTSHGTDRNMWLELREQEGERHNSKLRIK